MAFFKSPKGDLLHVDRIGGARALEKGLVLLGKGRDEVLEYIQCPLKVAEAWRDALAELLQGDHRGRPPQPDWKALAIAADPAWARQQGLAPAPVAPKA